MSALLPERGLSACGGEGQTEITFKRQRKEKILSSPWWSWAVFLGLCLRSFSFLTRFAALWNSPESKY